MPRPLFIPSTARPAGRGMDETKRKWLEASLVSYKLEIATWHPPVNTPLIIEIGYGNGEHLLHRAHANPDTLFLGCEVYLHGIAACIASLQQQSLNNVKLWDNDARLLLQTLLQHSVQTIYILFPDPWPKVRHYKRRIINQETLAMLYRILQPQGILQIATDHPDYAAWTLAQIQHHGGFEWLATQPSDWKTPPKGHIKTRYETKLKAGKQPVYLAFRSTYAQQKIDIS